MRERGWEYIHKRYPKGTLSLRSGAWKAAGLTGNIYTRGVEGRRPDRECIMAAPGGIEPLTSRLGILGSVITEFLLYIITVKIQ